MIVCHRSSREYVPLVHVAAAVVGEISSASVRTPFEVVKQRVQAGTIPAVAKDGLSVWDDISGILTWNLLLIIFCVVFIALLLFIAIDG